MLYRKQCATHNAAKPIILCGGLTGDGPAHTAVFKGLRSVDVDPWSGDVYLADAFNNRIRLLQHASALELESHRAYDNGGNAAAAQSKIAGKNGPGPDDRAWKTTSAVVDDLQYWNSPETEHQTRRRRLPTASASTAAAVSASASPLPHDAVAVSRPLVLIWVGQCGVYHDHVYNGQLLTEWLNTGNGTAGVSTHGAKPVPRWEARLERNTSVFERLDELKVKAIVFYSDAGVMSPSEESALVDWARRGGGVVGLHTAVATFAYAGPDTNGFVSLNPGYHEMLNGIFNGHSPYRIRCISLCLLPLIFTASRCRDLFVGTGTWTLR